MKSLLVAALVLSATSFVQAEQASAIQLKFDCYKIPNATFEALDGYLARGGAEASGAVAKLPQLPGVSSITSLERAVQSGGRAQLNNTSFSIEVDPQVEGDPLSGSQSGNGVTVSLAYELELNATEVFRFIGIAAVPLNEAFLLNAWADEKSESFIAVVITSSVAGAARSIEPDLDQVRSSVTVLKFRSSREAAGFAGQPELAAREGKVVYHQISLSRPGQRKKGEREGAPAREASVESEMLFSADRSELDLNLNFREDEDRYEAQVLLPMDGVALIPLKAGADQSKFGVIIETTYLGKPPEGKVLPNRLPDFSNDPNDLVTGTYTIVLTTLKKLRAGAGLTPDHRLPMKEILKANGIDFPAGAMASFNASSSEVIFRNVRSEHEKFFELIQ